MPSTLQSGWKTVCPPQTDVSDQATQRLRMQDSAPSVHRRPSCYTLNNTSVTLNAINKRHRSLCVQCVQVNIPSVNVSFLSRKAAQPPCQLLPCLLEKSLYQSQCVWWQQSRKGIKQQSVSMSLCIPVPLANLK